MILGYDDVTFDPADSPLRADSLSEALDRGRENLASSTDEFWSSPFGSGAAVPDGAQDLDSGDVPGADAVGGVGVLAKLLVAFIALMAFLYAAGQLFTAEVTL